MKKHHYFILLAAFIIASSIISSCSYTAKITDGKTAYDLKQYAEAAVLLKKEYLKSKVANEKAKKAYLIGLSHYHNNQTADAKTWFQTAYDDGYGPDAQRELGFALKREGKYAEAAKIFDQVGKEMGDPNRYRKEVSACRIAGTWAKEAKDNGTTVKQYEGCNSAASDFAPVFYTDNNLVITSDKNPDAQKDGDKSDKKAAKYGWTNRAFTDFYQVNLGTKTCNSFDETFNSPFNDGTIAFNKTFTEAFFTRCGTGEKNNAEKTVTDYCKIFRTTRTDATTAWTEPELVEVGITGHNVQHPALTKDGKRLYFASDSPDGSGKFDLFFVERKSENAWSEWKNAGGAINSEGNELFPNFDGDTLYFASDGHTGMGGLDIYKTFPKKGKWQPPFNLKAPINSSEDDFGLIVDYNKNKDTTLLGAGYFASSRAGGMGADDIYRYEKRKPKLPPPPPVVVKDPPKSIEYKIVLEVTVLKKKFAEDGNPNSKVTGFVPVVPADLKIESDDTTFSASVNEKATISFEIAENTSYNFNATSAGFFNKNVSYNAGLIEKNPKIPVTILKTTVILDKIYEDQEITLENIYYDYSKWDIRPDAMPTLNELADLLRRNPGINIQLNSHTDCRGSDNFNLSLSQSRAQSAVNYLISRGIAAERLTARGYGETAPAVNCVCAKCTEGEFQANRRTTFKVVK
jgi:peptidoglycan-associated lipoprotein